MEEIVLEDLEDKVHWKSILVKLEEIMYGENGIETIVLRERNLDKYLINTDNVITVFKELKLLEQEQNGFTEEQLASLENMRDDLLSLKYSSNNIVEIYNEFSKIYQDIEEY